MTVTVNGEKREIPDETMLGDVLRMLGITNVAGIAIAVNACVIPRSLCASRRVREGDAIEIVRAVAGG